MQVIKRQKIASPSMVGQAVTLMKNPNTGDIVRGMVLFDYLSATTKRRYLCIRCIDVNGEERYANPHVKGMTVYVTRDNITSMDGPSEYAGHLALYRKMAAFALLDHVCVHKRSKEGNGYGNRYSPYGDEALWYLSLQHICEASELPMPESFLQLTHAEECKRKDICKWIQRVARSGYAELKY
jgi:hypothetical protein